MGWFTREKAPKPIADFSEKFQMLEDVWTKCPGCAALLYSKELRKSFGVCIKCDYHFRLAADQRISLLVDRHSFQEIDSALRSLDPLNFKDSKRYKERLKKAEKTGGSLDAVVCGEGKIQGISVGLGVFNFGFMGGSMGSVVGEKLTRMIEMSIQKGLPAIIISASGGARMQEGIFSLMQMAKVSAALTRLGRAGLPYISILTDPTTGGVAASFAMLGDIIIAEPKALIGFAGPRVIEQTIRQKLPEGFQRSEFLLEHGMLDRIVPRAKMRDELARMLQGLGFNRE